MGTPQVEDETGGGEAPILGMRTTMKTVRPRWTAAIVAIMCTMDALAHEIRAPQNLTAPFSFNSQYGNTVFQSRNCNQRQR